MEAAAPEDANEDGSPLDEMALPDVPGLQEALANLGEEGRAMLMMFAGKGAPPDGEGGSGANGPPR